MQTDSVQDKKTKARDEKILRLDHRIERDFRLALRFLERVIAAITMLALTIAIGLEVYDMIVDPEYFADVTEMLHSLLTIVVGLEFVRMLIDTTPANILEVLTVAITRHVVVSHEDPWSNVACIACIAGLFAIRRFLIPRDELKEEMVKDE